MVLPQTSVASGGSMLGAATLIGTGTVPSNICVNISTTNLDSKIPDKSITLFPNPFETTITVQKNTSANNFSIVIKNLIGEEVFSHSYVNTTDKETQFSFDLSFLGAGLYLCQLEFEGHQSTFKIIKR